MIPRALLWWIRQPTPEELAHQELQEARRELLAAQSAAEFADAMAACYTKRIHRLNHFLKDPAK